MRHWIWGLMLLVLLMGCSGNSGQQDELLAKNWFDIEAEARGELVKFYMFGDDTDVNAWVDSYVAEEVKKRFGVNLVRVPVGARLVVKKLLTEKNGGEGAGGIDLFWLNGENFRMARENDLLFGPFAEKLPNFVKYVEKRQAAYDFGYPVEGYEAPFGRTQFVFEYDSAKIKTPPKNYMDLLKWAMDNPGRFTYPAPPDFVGSAFIRQVFYSVTGGPRQFEAGWDMKKYENMAPRVWEYLDEMKPYLWRAGMAYPKSATELDKLFVSGEVMISMAYGPQHPRRKVGSKEFGDRVRTFVMTEGTLFNMHFVAIPKSAPNKAAAMVVANFLLSPEAQLSKYRPENWGDYPALQLDALSKEQWDGFVAVEHGEATLDPQELAKHGVPEIGAEYVEALEKGWKENVR